jgi:hypothetical protein
VRLSLSGPGVEDDSVGAPSRSAATSEVCDLRFSAGSVLAQLIR